VQIEITDLMREELDKALSEQAMTLSKVNKERILELFASAWPHNKDLGQTIADLLKVARESKLCW
jgi:hypothetical protein